MNSISTSEPIVEVKNISLSYKMDYYRQSRGLRDSFISFAMNPIESLLHKKDLLTVLDNLTFNVQHGDRIGLIGVNGSGKTTLCRCISKMITPATGSIIVRGRIRAIFNATVGVQPELTGRENCHLLGSILYPELNNDELERTVLESLEFSELGHFVDIPFKNYSKGMQSRLCLSLLSARPSDLLILDEVSDGADEFFRKKMNKRLIQLISNSGAVIIVSHNIEHIRNTCNRAIVLNDFKIAFNGAVEQAITFYSKLDPKRSL
jgi:ABC-type polysaccharide/polyol phosphate transport system ATPase subunit